MHLLCECLNVRVEVENSLDLEVLHLDLAVEEKFHPYFSKDVFKMTGIVSGITEIHPCLVKSEIVGSWNLRQCLVCKMYTHGTNYVNGLTTFSSSLKEEPADLQMAANDRDMSFSQVYQILFPSRLDVPDDFVDNLPQYEIVDEDAIQKISKQANSFLESAEKKMGGPTRELTDRQRQAMEALKRRVQFEERVLLQLLIKAKESTLKGNIASDTSKESHSQYNICQHPVKSVESQAIVRNTLGEIENIPLRNTIVKGLNTKSRFQTFNVPVKSEDIEEELQRLQINSAANNQKNVQSGLSHDAEGIFEMDDVGSKKTETRILPENDDESDLEETPDSQSECEPVHFNLRDIARSVPLDVPPWPLSFGRPDRGIDSKMPRNPQEIAASMRELAQSMRVSSVDVFGDLPRPKLPSN